MQVTDRMTELLLRLLIALSNRDGLGNIQDKDVVELMDYVKGGGTLTSNFVPAQDKVYFANLLRDKHVPYHVVDITDPNSGEERSLFIFRQSDDRKIQLCLDSYARYLDGKAHELDEVTFVDTYEANGFFRVDGLRREELNVFRREALKYNMDFCVVSSEKEPGKYSVYANTRADLDRCVNDMLFMTCGKDGREYLEKIGEYDRKQNIVYEQLAEKAKGTKPVVIVDAANPAKMITVANGGYVRHHLKTFEDELPDGTVDKSVVDNNPKKVMAISESIMADLSDFKHPVLIEKPEDLGFIKSISPDGTIQADDAFADIEYVRNVRKNLRTFDPIIEKPPVHQKKTVLDPAVMRSYTNLPMRVIKELQAENIPDVYINGRDIAFEDSALPAVMAVFEKTIYKDVSPLKRMELELLYQGRGTGHLTDIPEGEKYIVGNGYNASEWVEVDSKGYTPHRDRLPVDTISASSTENYDQVLLETIKSIPVPVLVQTPEDISEKMVPLPEDNKAVQKILQMDKDEREALDRYTAMAESELVGIAMTQVQKEAVERRRELRVEYQKEVTKDEIGHAHDRQLDRTAKKRAEKGEPER